MNKTTEPVALAGIEPIDYVYRGSDGLIYRTIPQDVPVIETIPRYSAATVEQLVHERDALLAEKVRWHERATHYLGTTCESVADAAILRHQLAAMTKKADGFFDALQLAAKINAEGQAREQQLREALEKTEWLPYDEVPDHQQTIAHDALALPQDDTALRQWGAKLLEPAMHAINEWADTFHNATGHIQNIRDGITAPDAALANLKECQAHCEAVWDVARRKADELRAGK